MEYVVLVDENDHEIGTMEKQAAHVTPHLHRAFSIFLFNSKGELLMQQRALSKYHSPGLWTNTCCSHPRDGETLEEATSRRLWPVGQGLTEHEFDHVFIGQSDDIPCINTEEVASWKYMTIDDLSKDIALYPGHYTEWFKITFEEMTRHAELIGKN